MRSGKKVPASKISKEPGIAGNQYIVQRFIFETPKLPVVRKLLATIILSFLLDSFLFSQIFADLTYRL